MGEEEHTKSRRSLEEQSEAWFAARARADPAAELARREALAGTWPSRAEMDAVHRRVLRAFQAAARPLAAGGWDVRTSRALWRSAQGDWARISVWREGWRGAELAWIQLHLYSARLLEVVDRRDPSVEPTQTGGPAHLAFHTEFAFTPGTGDADPVPAPVPNRVPGLDRRPLAVIDPSTAGAWLGDAVQRTAAAVMAWLSSDTALRDALVAVPLDVDYMAIRRAAILSWLIGDLAALPGLLAEAANRSAAAEAAFALDPAWQDVAYDPHAYDRTRDMLLWSHDRFLRYMERDLPKRAAALAGTPARRGAGGGEAGP